ncbi:MAG: hypothetical protein JSW10_06960 [Pseudomonadota bacterium]|nr:MAG: hypothetical protein JSW10_06960 [Pseudomonadota bacterium]
MGRKSKTSASCVIANTTMFAMWVAGYALLDRLANENSMLAVLSLAAVVGASLPVAGAVHWVCDRLANRGAPIVEHDGGNARGNATV